MLCQTILLRRSSAQSRTPPPMTGRPISGTGFDDSKSDLRHATSLRPRRGGGLRPAARYEGPESAYQDGVYRYRLLLPEVEAGAHAARADEAELVQQDQKVDSTIVLFGSARLKPRDEALGAAGCGEQRRCGGDPSCRAPGRDVALLRRGPKLGEIVARDAEALGELVVLVTGGARHHGGRQPRRLRGGRTQHGHEHRAALRAGAQPLITPELCFQFHYFAIRKMHFLMRRLRW